jgi:hypothetical protein
MNKVLFTGGLGDVLSVEARMTDAEKYAVREIYLATPGAKFIREALSYHYLWSKYPIVELLTREEIFSYSPSKYCIHNMPELIKTCKIAGKPTVPNNVVDMGIIRIFSEIRAKKRPWNQSGFAFPRRKCDIAFDPITTSGDHRIINRSFTEPEIIKVREYAVKNKLNIVELGEGKTTFDEYVGYVRGCREFIGVDSAASILAVIDKVTFPEKKVFVRSNNAAWYNHRSEWYAPDAMDFFYDKEYK